MRLEEQKQLTPNVELNIKDRKQHEYKHIGSIRSLEHLGMKLWECKESGEIELAGVKRTAIATMKNEIDIKLRVEHNPKSIYIWALNIKNAQRKFTERENNS